MYEYKINIFNKFKIYPNMLSLTYIVDELERHFFAVSRDLPNPAKAR